MALICKTNKSDCCAAYHNRHGEWYYPSGSQVKTEGANRSTLFYRDRTDDGEVRLNKRNNIMQVITGTYSCEIPESDDNCGITQRLYVNLGE